MDSLVTHLQANPEDWETRLVYADWLEENGLADKSGQERRRAINTRDTTTWFKKRLAGSHHADLLAAAMAWGLEVGTNAEWGEDTDCQDYDEEEDTYVDVEPCLWCCVTLAGGQDRECLGAIGAPSHSYRLAVEAELTYQLMRRWKADK